MIRQSKLTRKVMEIGTSHLKSFYHDYQYSQSQKKVTFSRSIFHFVQGFCINSLPFFMPTIRKNLANNKFDFLATKFIGGKIHVSLSGVAKRQ